MPASIMPRQGGVGSANPAGPGDVRTFAVHPRGGRSKVRGIRGFRARRVGIMEQRASKLGWSEGPYTGRRGPGVNGRTEGPLLAREEQQLVEGLLAGNEDAVRALYARFARPIFTLGLRLLGSSEAAEELTQDVFLTAWRKA